MDFIKTYTINFGNLKNIIDKDVAEDWDDLICENDGYFTREDQFISFDVDGNELVVCFELGVSGTVDYDPGDYWNPSYTDVDITDIDVCVSDIYFNDYDLYLDKDIIGFLEGKIKDIIY